MKKKLIALGVAGALAAPLMASAQGTHVTIFGRVQAEYATVDTKGNGAQTGVLDDAAQSRWGLQVAEDLGMGFRAMGRVEFSFNPGSGRSDSAREQWVGLGSNQWGEVKFGRVQSPFKDFAGGHTIDPFSYTSLHANGSGGLMVASQNGLGSGDNSFVNSAARYDSPVVEGFQMSAMLMPGDARKLDPSRSDPTSAGFTPGVLDPLAIGQPFTGANSGGEDGEWDFQVAGKYSNQFDALGLDIFGGYSRDNVSNRMKSLGGVLNDEEIWRGGALISFADLRVRGQYEYVNNANPLGGAATCTTAAAFGNAVGSLSLDGRGQCNSAMNANGDGYLWFAGVDYTIGNTMLIAQGGMAHAYSLSGGAGSKDVENITAGVIHSLSRRSSLFGGYQRVWVKDRNLAAIGQDGDRNVYSVGLRHDF
ncbi:MULTISPECIES: porin [Nitrosomonas]|uniref:Porin n=1 Tax=Nitrosomonas communis TaxID=44574 RepID=A0A0F7KK60_9PROT|nr:MULTISPECIES: porin [Nitrosomonas]AKH39299.1 porin [Nitrosomonas communis]TYP90862.1 putative porin [Nitrosomonas communis]UVS61522.1 porin [Nitrosomonas sp. PLL12]